MKLAARCRKHLAVLLAIGGAISASSRLSLAAPPAADKTDGALVVVFLIDPCEPVSSLRASIIGLDAIPGFLEDTAPAFEPLADPRDLLNVEGSSLCETILFLVPLPEPDQDTIVPLDAAVWSRSGPRMGAATAFP